MTGWTLFFTIIGVLFLTAQLFRLIDAIERPAHSAPARKSLPVWNEVALRRVLLWMFWKN